jgi:hypothetical protein
LGEVIVYSNWEDIYHRDKSLKHEEQPLKEKTKPEELITATNSTDQQSNLRTEESAQKHRSLLSTQLTSNYFKNKRQSHSVFSSTESIINKNHIKSKRN